MLPTQVVMCETQQESWPMNCVTLCSREKYPMLFEEPVLLTANSWYVALSKISGPSSDCGSNGQYVVTGEDQ